MTRTVWAAARAAAAACLALLVTASTGGARDNLPDGPWRQSCRNISVQGGWLLRASCLNDRGQWRDASFDIRTCDGILVNRGARLHCEGGGGRPGWSGGNPWGGSWSGRLPAGTWQQVCRNGSVDRGGLFRAQCLNNSGEWRDSSYDLRTCPEGRLYSRGAYLHCGDASSYGGGASSVPWVGGYGGYQGGDQGGVYASYQLPPGPWRQECRNAFIQGRSLLRANCLNRKGQWRDASIDLRSCSRGGYVYSDGGRLSCD
jgi:hypothetical protein